MWGNSFWGSNVLQSALPTRALCPVLSPPCTLPPLLPRQVMALLHPGTAPSPHSSTTAMLTWDRPCLLQPKLPAACLTPAGSRCLWKSRRSGASLTAMFPEPSPSKRYGVSSAPHRPLFRQDELWVHSPSMQPAGGMQPESTRGSFWHASVVKAEVSCHTKPLKSHFLICPLAMPAGCDLGGDFFTSEISSAVDQYNDAAESQAAVRHLKICSRCGRLEQRSQNGH